MGENASDMDNYQIRETLDNSVSRKIIGENVKKKVFGLSILGNCRNVEVQNEDPYPVCI